MHIPARLEHWNNFLGNRHCFARAGVAPHPGIALPHRKCAEAAKLSPSTLGKRARNGIEDCLHDLLDVALIQVGVLLRELLDQLGFDHVGYNPFGLVGAFGKAARRAGDRQGTGVWPVVGPSFCMAIMLLVYAW